MKLYITPTSPYARIARIVVLEKGLEKRVEVVTAQTRVSDSPYYRINPSPPQQRSACAALFPASRPKKAAPPSDIPLT
jgi:hypothetical protein